MTRPYRPATGLVAAVLALGLAGCASTTAGTGTPATGITAGAGSPTAPAASGSAGTGGGAATPVPTTTAGVVAFGSVRMPLTSGTRATVDGEYLCVTLLNDTGCSLEVLDVGRLRAAGGSVSTPAPGAEFGWWWGSDVPTCGDADDASPVRKSTVVEKGFKKIGPKTAQYGSWLVSCENSDQDFDPRLWWLPTSQLAFRERTTVAGTAAAVDTLLAGVTFAG